MSSLLIGVLVMVMSVCMDMGGTKARATYIVI